MAHKFEIRLICETKHQSTRYLAVYGKEKLKQLMF